MTAPAAAARPAGARRPGPSPGRWSAACRPGRRRRPGGDPQAVLADPGRGDRRGRLPPGDDAGPLDLAGAPGPGAGPLRRRRTRGHGALHGTTAWAGTACPRRSAGTPDTYRAWGGWPLMESAEIARRFLAYFSERGHTVVPSASVIADDPTLLLVNAGMQPFKPYSPGQASPPFRRATSAQKCIRTPDIEEVGKTTRHGTFFQMLGNFSFGDYFKEQAIPFAWELLTTPERDGGFGFPEDRLWATVYYDDDEAARIWRDVVGVPESRIQRRGMADNFWSMGVPGPCGPCSEIYYDRGPDYGRDGGPESDEDRYLEVWNLVFMQYLRGEGAGKEGWPILGELPSRNIDTGMGLERMAAILQGVDNIYEIDTLWKVLDRAAELTEQKYGRDHRVDVSLRVVADHVRTAVMMVADGVLPSNEGRGYVLRRILRRSVYNLRLLAGGQRGGGSEGRYLHELAETALGAMADLYPELVEAAPRVLGVIDAEEATFLSTLRTGSAIFDAAVGESKRRGAATLSGGR